MVSIDEQKIIDRIPRKIIGGFAFGWLLYKAAMDLPPGTEKIVAMSFIAGLGVITILSHLFLEWKNPTKETNSTETETTQNSTLTTNNSLKADPENK